MYRYLLAGTALAALAAPAAAHAHVALPSVPDGSRDLRRSLKKSSLPEEPPSHMLWM